MESLRWILLGIGITIVVAVYFWGKARKRDASYSTYVESNDVPSLSSADDRVDEYSNGWCDGVGPVRVVESFSDDEMDSFTIDDSTAPVNEAIKDPVEAAPVKVVSHAKVKDPIVNDATVDTLEPDDEALSDTVEKEVIRQTQAPTEKKPEPKKPEPKKSSAQNDVVSLYLVAQRDNDLKGEQILSASYAVDLEYGEMNIFHRKDSNGKIIFSMANMMNPGTFDIEHINDMSTRGISLFIQLALCDEPVTALDEMLLCSHELAGLLNAQICDQDRQLLNETFTRTLREKAKSFAK